MKIEIENLQGHYKKVTIELPAERYLQRSDVIAGDIRKDVELKGFRKGKAPIPMVREMYGDTIRNRVTRELVEESLGEALQQNSLSPASTPEIQVESASEIGGLKFIATFENTPPVELKNYKGFQAASLPTTVADDEVEKAIGHLQAQLGKLEPLPDGTPVEKGLFLQIDHDASEAGAAFEAATDKNAVFEFGAGSLTPEFEKNLAGAKAGDVKKFTVKFPEPKTEEERTPASGRTLDFEVKVHKVMKRDLPALDDAFAKQLGNFESLSALKSKLREDIQADKERKNRSDAREKAIDWLISQNPVDVPETMVARQMEQLAVEAGMQLQRMGLDEKAIEARLKDWGEDMSNRAQRQVKASLVLSGIARKEEIKASEDDIRKEIQAMAVQMRKSPKDIWEEIQSKGWLGGLVRQITELKALDYVVTQAGANG